MSLPFQSVRRRFKRRKIQYIAQEQIPELQRVEDLLYKGNLRKALDTIEKLEKKEKLEEDGLLRSQILKSHLLIETGQSNDGLKLAKRAHNGSLKTGSVLTIVDALIAKACALCQLGRLTECLRELNEGENLLLANVEDQLEFSKRDAALKLIKGKVFRRTGELDNALELIQESLTIQLEQGNVFATADPLNNLGILYVQKGELDIGLKYLEQSLKVYDDAGNQGQIVKLRNNIGMIYSNKGELDLALDYYHKALTDSEKLGNKRFISALSVNIGMIYFSRGELNSALEYYQKSLTIFEELKSQAELASCLNNIGNVYEIRGELDRALEFYERSLIIVKELRMKQEMADGLHNLGKIYHEKGDFEAAVVHYNDSLELYEQIGNNLDIVGTITNLIRLAVSQGDSVIAEKHLTQLQEISEKEDNKLIDQNYRFSKAIILKDSDRVIKRAEAQQLFKEISEEEVLSADLTSEAMFNLCELIYLELQTSGSEEALNELKTVLQQLLVIAEEQQNFSLYVQTNLLQSKAALLELDVKKAQQLLSRAQQIAEEKGLVKLAMMASGEYDSLLDQIGKWDTFIEQEVSMKERLQLTQLESMVTKLIHKKDVEVPERPPEEAVMLLILSKTGLSLFSRAFGEESRVDDQLVGGFLTALTSFGSEIFTEAGAIDRIMYEEYTVALRVADPLMFCYMFKGQSYGALQKLDKLSIAVQDATSIWNGLLGTLDTGDLLKSSEEEKLEKIINEIY
ncbi:MAG: tetratricopeptide repeat protein [Promethearchaeota archaeon]